MPSISRSVPNMSAQGPIIEVGLAVGARVEQLLKGQGEGAPQPVKALALIDSGAAQTGIDVSIVKQLNLQNPVGSTTIATATQSGVLVYRCSLRVIVPCVQGDVVIEAITNELKLHPHGINCLIGRDILKHSTFVYLGHSDAFSLSF